MVLAWSSPGLSSLPCASGLEEDLITGSEFTSGLEDGRFTGFGLGLGRGIRESDSQGHQLNEWPRDSHEARQQLHVLIINY